MAAKATVWTMRFRQRNRNVLKGMTKRSITMPLRADPKASRIKRESLNVRYLMASLQDGRTPLEGSTHESYYHNALAMPMAR